MKREALVLAGAIALTACGGSSKPAENASNKSGDGVDDTANQASDKSKDLKDDTKDKVEDVEKKANPEEDNANGSTTD